MVCLADLLLEPSEQHSSVPFPKPRNQLADAVFAPAIDETTLQPWPNLHVAEIINCLHDYLRIMREQDDDSHTTYSCADEEDRVGWCEAPFDERERVIDVGTWTDVESPITVVTYDQAVHDAWVVAKQEISIVRENMMLMLKLQRISEFSSDKLLDYMIGSKSELWHLVDSNLNGSGIYSSSNPLTHEVFIRVVGAFFVASSLGMSSKTLWDEPLIDKSNLCTYDEYITFWKAVSTKDHKGRFDVSTNYLWLQILDHVNALCRAFFLRNWEPHVEKFITIDDDKNHFNGRMSFYNTAGLKPTQLVRDNRRGFVFHTLVFTASGIPLGIEAELVTDSNSNDTSTRLITRQLCPSHRSQHVPNLSNVSIFADRLYWTNDFLYNFIIPSGADVAPSTHKKSHNFPFTFDQKLTRNDTRTLVTTKGSKCMFLKEKKVGSTVLSAIAYRDGHGKVAMGLSSGSHQYPIKHWDFHLSDPSDRYHMLADDDNWTDNCATWIRNLKGNSISSTFMDLFYSTCNVKAMTTKGSEDQAWFVARSFSFTSSTTDKIIHAVYDVAKKNEYVLDNGLIKDLNAILAYLHKPLIHQSVELISNDDGNSDSSTLSAVDDDTLQTPDTVVDGCNISQELRFLNLNSADLTASFLNRLRQRNDFSDQCIKSLLELLGKKSLSSRGKNIDLIESWVNTPMEKRKYIFMSKAQLIDCCLAKFHGSKTSYIKKKNDELIDLLAQPQHATEDITQVTSTQAPDLTQQPSSNILSERLLKEILAASFLKPLTGGDRKNCRIGLENEEALLLRLIEYDSVTLSLLREVEHEEERLVVSEIYRPGMVRKQSKQYMKTSIDALGVLLGAAAGDSPELIGIELKTRTVEKTRSQEIAFRNNLQRGKKFVKISYKLANRFIPNEHECIQILHHASVYNLKMVLLLIGDAKGTILRGVWVVFDDELKSSYESFLASSYQQSLKWAYDESNHDYVAMNSSSTLESVKPFLPSSVDFESFRDYFELWKQASNSIHSRLPLPSTSYIIPYHFAKWNKFKGGSDTITKLFWNANHFVPSDTPAAYAISRLFRFLAVILFRCDAVMTSKENLDFYESLLRWRQANNQRQSSFETFLRTATHLYLNKKQETKHDVVVTPSKQEERGSRRRIVQLEATFGNEKTFKTPMRNAAKQYGKGRIDNGIVQRREVCRGNISYRITIDSDGKPQMCGPGSRGKCVICHDKTRFYCLDCHHWLCGPDKFHTNDVDKPVARFVLEADGSRTYFRHSCWHMWHENALSKTDNDDA